MQTLVSIPRLTPLLALACLATPALAYQPGQDATLNANVQCHLMTDAECRQHASRLQQLTDLVVREAYLAEHQALIQERAALCGAQSGFRPSLYRASR